MNKSEQVTSEITERHQLTLPYNLTFKLNSIQMNLNALESPVFRKL